MSVELGGNLWGSESVRWGSFPDLAGLSGLLAVAASSTNYLSKAVHWHPVDGLFHSNGIAQPRHYNPATRAIARGGPHDRLPPLPARMMKAQDLVHGLAENESCRASL